MTNEAQLPFQVHRATQGSLEADILESVANPNLSRVGKAPFYIKSEGDSREGMLWRQCTKEYKLAPLRRMTRKVMEAAGVKSCVSVIGISWDEATRMRRTGVKYITNEYPLVDRRLTRVDCLRCMKANGYPMPAKSACYFCPYTDDMRWRDMKMAAPDEFARAVTFDAAIRDGLPGVKGQAYLHRSLLPLDQGKGSRFTVRLPALSTDAAVVAHDPAPVTVPSGPYRILVVDDNRAASETLATLLRLTGHETLTAFDGKEAIAAAAQFRPDVVLLDIGLPRTNGYDVARHLRTQSWGRNAKLIALTGWGQDEDRRKSQEAGFDAHIVKPVDHAYLIQLLATLASMSQPAHASGDASAKSAH